MNQSTRNSAGFQAARIGSKFGLCFAVYIAISIAILLLDRAGAPGPLVLALGPALAVLAVALVGMMTGTMQVSQFHGGGRRLSSMHAGLGLGGLAMMLVLMEVGSYPDEGQLTRTGLSMGAGLLIAAFGIGPLLRRSGAFSLVGLLSARFPGTLFKLAVLILLAVPAALIGLAALAFAERTLHLATGLGTWACAGLLTVLLATITLPGGITGAVWALIGGAACFLGALVMSIGLLAFQQVPLPLPILGDRAALASTLAQLSGFGGAAGHAPALDAIPAVTAVGFSVLLTTSGIFASVQRVGIAVRAGVAGLFWGGFMALLALAMLALSVQAIDRDLTGKKPGLAPDAAIAASARGELAICGKAVTTPASAQAACTNQAGAAATLRASDLAPTMLTLISGLALVRSPPTAASGLILAGILLLAVALAAVASQAIAGSYANDGFYRLRDQSALASRRLAIARVALLLVILAGAALTVGVTTDPQRMTELAGLLSSALIAPLLLLVIWPLATTRDAGIALLAGVIAALVRGPRALAGFDDLSEAVIGIAATCLATGLLASFFHQTTNRPRWFFRYLFTADGEMLPTDKGA